MNKTKQLEELESFIKLSYSSLLRKYDELNYEERRWIFMRISAMI